MALGVLSQLAYQVCCFVPSSLLRSSSLARAGPKGPGAANLPPKAPAVSHSASLATRQLAPKHAAAAARAPGPGPLIGAYRAVARSLSAGASTAAHALLHRGEGPANPADKAPAGATPPAGAARPPSSGARSVQRRSPSNGWHALGLPEGVPLADLAMEQSRRSGNMYEQNWFGREPAGSAANQRHGAAPRHQVNAQEWIEQQRRQGGLDRAAGGGYTGPGAFAGAAATAGAGASMEASAPILQGNSRPGSKASGYGGAGGRRAVLRSPPPFLASGARAPMSVYDAHSPPGPPRSGPAGPAAVQYGGGGFPASSFATPPPHGSAFASARGGSSYGGAAVATAVDLARRSMEGLQQQRRSQQQQYTHQHSTHQQQQDAIYAFDSTGTTNTQRHTFSCRARRPGCADPALRPPFCGIH